MKMRYILLALISSFLLITATSCAKKNPAKYSQQSKKDLLGKEFVYQNKSYKPGDTVYGFKNYIKLVVGDFDAPLLLGVPHDGKSLGKPEMPETGTTGGDINTLPLAVEIARNFKKSTKKQAWIIINTISRKCVDPNTYPNQVDSRYYFADAKSTYLSYHDLLSAAREKMAAFQKNGKGALFLDLHGHAHKYSSVRAYTTATGRAATSAFIDQTELGYGINAATLNKSDIFLDGVSDSSSISAIARANPKVRFSEIIRGEYSFGALLEAQGIVAVPSPTLKNLEQNEELFGTNSKGVANRRPYFNGGYCLRKYGTARLGSMVGHDDNISAIQAETPGITVRNNQSVIDISGPRFNKAIIAYLNKWFGYNFSF